MKVKEFIKELEKFNGNAEILLGCDEELNTIYSDLELSYLDGYQEETNNRVVMWGNSGSEVDEE